jgi:hypothetical protein
MPPRHQQPDQPVPIARSLGRLVGSLMRAAGAPPRPSPGGPATPAGQPTTRRVRETHEQQAGEVGGQPVILRRTTIEEIEFRSTE